MTSPYSSGGGGFRFEDRVVAYYLTGLLTESVARGLIGAHPTVLMAQRAQLGHPLDDIIIEGVTVEGATSRLSIQLKSKLTFTAGDDEWTETVRRAWVSDAADEAELDDIYETERRLLYVACTRARDRLLVCGVAPGSEFLSDLEG